MQERKRPTSPHLQIYKPQISSFTSIFHRFTGIILYLSLIAISWFIVYFAYQTDFTETFDQAPKCDCVIYKTVLYGALIFITFALFYHFCNGIRHLFWDIGKGFDKQMAKFNGIIVIISAFLLTAITVALVLFFNLT